MIYMPVWWRINSAKIHYSVGVRKSGRERDLGSLGEEMSVDCSFVGERVTSFLQIVLCSFCWVKIVCEVSQFSVLKILESVSFPLFRSLPGFFFPETFPDSLTWGCSHLTAVPPGCLVGWSAHFVNFMSPCLFSSWLLVQPVTLLPVFCFLTVCPSSHYLLASVPIPNAVTTMNLVNIVLEANRLFFRQMEPGLRLKINSNWVVCCTPALPQALHAGKQQVVLCLHCRFLHKVLLNTNTVKLENKLVYKRKFMRLYSESIYYALTFFMCMCAYSYLCWCTCMHLCVEVRR